MATINKIEHRTVHQIQSGQVIVDLGSVVKELVENSLDSGATTIDVRFKNQGLDSVEVQDNGSGIVKENFENVALKHCTSKLSTYTDLASLETFGFRGEALASLCALSNVTITTCCAPDVPRGSKLTFESSGKLDSVTVVASQKGTAVLVENLFYTLPVRRRELERNIKREWGKVITLLNQYACIKTGVKFTVSQQPTKGKRTVLFSTKGNPTARENVINIFGAKALATLVSLDLRLTLVPTASSTTAGIPIASQLSPNPAEVIVNGLMSRPAHGEGRQAPDRQMFYVNGRPCGLPQVARVFNEVYKSYNTSQSPFILADVQLETSLYDVNVSPDKRTVLLHDQTQLLESLRQALVIKFEEHDYALPTGQLFSAKNVQTSLQRQSGLGSPQHRALSTQQYHAQDMPSPDSNTSTSPEPQGIATTNAGDANIGHQAFKYMNTYPEINTVSQQTAHNLMSGETHADGGPDGIEALDHEPTNPKQAASSSLCLDLNPHELTTSRSGHTIFEQMMQNRPQAETNPTPPYDRPGRKKLKRQEATSEWTNYVHEEEEVGSDNEEGSECCRNPIRPHPQNFASACIPDENGFTDKLPKVAYSDKPSISRMETLPHKSSQVYGLHPHAAVPSSHDDIGAELPPPDPPRDPSELEDQRHRLHTGIYQFSRYAREGRYTRSVGSQRHDPSFVLPVAENEPSNVVEIGDGVAEEHDIISSSPLALQTVSSTHNQLPLTKATCRAKVTTRKVAQHISTTEQAIRTSIFQWTKSLLCRKSPSASPMIKEIDAADAEAQLSLIISKKDFEMMRVVGQFNLGFILATRPASTDDDNDELFIVDQHASDEKYNFERLQAETTLQSQRLVCGKRLELTAYEEEIVLDNMAIIEANGFKIDVESPSDEPIGSRCLLRALPLSRETTFTISDLQELIYLLGEQESASGSGFLRPSKVRKMLAMRACRSSIMIGKALTQTQMEKIVRSMGKLDKPWNCPHGRPTMRHLATMNPWDRTRWRGDCSI